MSAQTAGLIAVGAQVGYALGILLVLPLADVIASRKLVRTLLAAILTGLLLLIVPRLIPNRERGATDTGYLNLLSSLPPFLRHRLLRLSITLGFLVFGAFSAFMVRKMNHRFENFLTMNSSVNNAVIMRHRERYSHKTLFLTCF